MKIKPLKNKLCAVGLTAALVLGSLSGINMGQYKVAHAGSRDNILVASAETVSYSTVLFSGEKVTVNLIGCRLVVTIDGTSYTFSDNDENEDVVKTCVVDEKERLLHIAVTNPDSQYCYYYCMSLLDGTYMQIYKNDTNGLYSLPSNSNASIATINTDILLNDKYYIDSKFSNLYLAGHYLSSWMKRQEYHYIYGYGGGYDPSDAATCSESDYIEGGNGALEGTLSDETEISITLSDYRLSMTTNYDSYPMYYSWQEDIDAVSLDADEDLLHVFDSDGYYSCMDLRTGNLITVYNDAETGEFCTSSFKNAVRTTRGSYLSAFMFVNTKYFLQYISSNSNTLPFPIIRQKRLLTRYEFNQLREGISPCNGTVCYDQGQIIYQQGTKRKLLCLRGFAPSDKYGLDEYGTLWFMSLMTDVYWYNEEIAEELEVLGDTFTGQRLQKNGSNVAAKSFCWNSNNSVITGYYNWYTLLKEELPSYNELREIVGLSSQPTKTPDNSMGSDAFEATATPEGGADYEIPAEATATPKGNSGGDTGYEQPEPDYSGGNTTSEPAGTPTPAVTPAPVKTPQSSSTTQNPNKATAIPKSTKKPTFDFDTSVSSAKKSAVISAVSSIKKAYGKKKFNINATTNSDGRLTYKSSNTKVVTVDDSGNVTMQGYGTAKITIQVVETTKYQFASKTVAISIVPAKLKNFKAKSKAPGKITFTWKKQKMKNAKCQIQASSSVKFTSTKSVKPSPMLKKGKYIAGGLKRGSSYYFRARVVLKVSGKTYYSDWVRKKARIK